MLDLLNSIIKGKSHKKDAEKKRAKRLAMLEKELASLDKLERSVGNSELKPKFKKFYTMVKGAFKEALEQRHQLTFMELKEEVTKSRKFSPALKEEALYFLDILSTMEYGFPYLKSKIDEQKHERERLLHEYIKDLESEGDNISPETKKKISLLVSDTLPHSDRELLLDSIRKFRKLLPKIFS